jgi:hypothetical protein
MLKFFKRNRPAHRAEVVPAYISREDAEIMAFLGIKLADWDLLNPMGKADKRDEFYYSKGLAS